MAPPPSSSKNAFKKQTMGSSADIDMDASEGTFSLEAYCVGVDGLPSKLWLPYSPLPPHRKSLLEIGLNASDPENQHPESLVDLKVAFCQHFRTERAASANKQPAAVYGKGKHVMSKFISTWTTESAAENAIKRKGIEGPPQPVGETALWKLYSIDAEKLENTGTLIFDAMELRQTLLDKDLLEERELAETDTEGVFLIWSEVKTQVLVGEREVSKERLWELGLEQKQLEVIEEGIQLGALQVLETDHGVVDLIDFQGTVFASRKGKEVVQRKVENASAPSNKNLMGAGTQTPDVENYETAELDEVDNSKHDFGEAGWELKRIVAHRPPSFSPTESTEYLVEWAGTLPKKEKYHWRLNTMVGPGSMDEYWNKVAYVHAAVQIGDANEAEEKEEQEKADEKAKKKKEKQQGKKGGRKR